MLSVHPNIYSFHMQTQLQQHKHTCACTQTRQFCPRLNGRSENVARAKHAINGYLLIRKKSCFQIYFLTLICFQQSFYCAWAVFLGIACLCCNADPTEAEACHLVYVVVSLVRGAWPCFQGQFGGSQISSQTSCKSRSSVSKHSKSGRMLQSFYLRMVYILNGVENVCMNTEKRKSVCRVKGNL